MRRRSHIPSAAKTTDEFNVGHSNPVRHRRIGVWDYFEQRRPSARGFPGLHWVADIRHTLPYVWQMVKDLASLEHCRILFLVYFLSEWFLSMVPAFQLANQGQMLDVVKNVVDQRAVDTHLLARITIAGLAYTVLDRLLEHCKYRVSNLLSAHIRSFYSTYIFHAMSRLDVPTFDDQAIHDQIQAAVPQHSENSTPWMAIGAVVSVCSVVFQVATQFFVLLSILKDQPHGSILATLTVSHIVLANVAYDRRVFTKKYVWLATTDDQEYLRTEGLKQLIASPEHRKEIVAANLGPFLVRLYKESMRRLGYRGGAFMSIFMIQRQADKGVLLTRILLDFIQMLPEAFVAYQAILDPTSLPLSVASLHLIRRTTLSFTGTMMKLMDQASTVIDRLVAIQRLYMISKIPNFIAVQVPDSKIDPFEDHAPTSACIIENIDEKTGIPFPEDAKSLETGIEVEFRNVSFRYPGNTEYALQNVSFRIQPGQLCVIVGHNGSGKSTILKLMVRIYDPSEGTVFINGRDIKTLRLADIRKAVSVLFQDYTVFPLTILENIAVGDPEHFHSLDHIKQAAELGGAAEFIEKLPDGYDSFIDRPVREQYSPVTSSLKSRNFRQDFENLKKCAGLPQEDGYSGNRGLSGGQLQRIALSRSFMRSVVSEGSVGLLLFDEPSASLDPRAEFDLFERLRNLRGQKTMIFSSHRFGNLTRHADIILYMDHSQILEEGTHDELLKQDGHYAELWKIQAGAFL